MKSGPASVPRFRGYEPGDEARIAGLFERCYGRPTNPAHWRWKLRTRPAHADSIVVAMDGDRLVFLYAGVPGRLLVDGRERPVFLAVDAMTDPDYRRRGLLTEGARRAAEAWRDAGIALTYGLPNEQWGSRTRALGWRPLFSLEWRLLPLRPGAMLGRKLGVPWLSGLDVLGKLARPRADASDEAVSVDEVGSAGETFDTLWQRSVASIGTGLVHDAAWVGWRYLSADPPYRVLLAESAGTPSGYAAYRVVDGHVGILAEVFAPADPASARALVLEVIARLHAAQADRVLALAAPGSPADRLLSELRFLRRGRGFGVEAVPLAPDLDMEALADASRWHLSGGDFDVV